MVSQEVGFSFAQLDFEQALIAPTVQAILIADNVYEDKATGKKVVAGIFDNLFFVDHKQLQDRIQKDLQEKGIEGSERKIPGGMQAGSPSCYIRLNNIRGEQAFSVRYVYVNEEQVLLKTAFSINCNDPLRSVDVVLPLPMLPANKVGTFALELVWNDEVIGAHRLVVKEMEFPEEGE